MNKEKIRQRILKFLENACDELYKLFQDELQEKNLKIIELNEEIERLNESRRLLEKDSLRYREMAKLKQAEIEKLRNKMKRGERNAK